MFFSWFGCGDQALPEDADGWRHAQTLPRLLELDGAALDRSGLAIPVDADYGMVRSCPLEVAGETLELDLYVDHSFHELHLNGGGHTFTFRAYL